MKIMLLISGIILAFLMESCCNTCDSGNNPTDGSSEFSVIYCVTPFNSLYPSVFESNLDGKNIREIVKNADLYSSPAGNGKIVYLRRDVETGKNLMLTVDYDGKNEKLIAQDNSIFKIEYPLIAFDAQKIAFVSNSNQLIVYDIANTLFNQVSDKITKVAKPCFSPDGKMIAFLESDANNSNLTLKVIDANNTNNINVLFSNKIVNHDFAKMPFIWLNWSDNSDYISFTFSNSNHNYIDVANIKSGNVIAYEVPIDNFGLKYAQFSSVNQMLLFQSNDGNVWTRNLSMTSSRFSKLTTVFENEQNIAPKWSENGKFVLYLNYNNLEQDNSALFVIDVQKNGETAETTKSRIVSNNCISAFWYKK